MRRISFVLLLLTSAFSISAAPARQPVRQARIAEVDLHGTLPADLVSPEGKTRWDLTALKRQPAFVRSFEPVADGLTVADGCAGRAVFTDTDGVSVSRWLMPDGDREKLRPGTRETIDLYRARGGAEERLRIDTEIVGIGWVHLPSGPHEVVLQRALIQGGAAGGRTVYRWIDPREGVVAEAAGSKGVEQAMVLEQTLLGAANLVLYVEDFDGPPLTNIAYGWNRGKGATVASLTPANHATIGDLLAANTWDFSGNTTGVEIASTSVPQSAAETCNISSCGYNFPGSNMDRDDIGFFDADPNNNSKNNTVTNREQRAGDVTIWLRAGTQHEGKGGTLTEGESRFCYITDGTGTRNMSPLYRFIHQDARGWYMQPGDPAWTGGPGGLCQQTLYNCVCGSCGSVLQTLWASGNRAGCTNHTGTQGGGVVKTGVVTVPSGHTFNAMIVSNLADFCVYGTAACGEFGVISEVKTSTYLWQVPVLGTVVRLQSPQNADPNTWTTVDETNIIFGLFPPRSITSTGSTNTTVSLSWDPGLDTHRISGYKIYWDTDSGSASSYAFNSVANAGRVSFAGTTATISGLSPGTTYFFTVTSRSTYTDPSSGVVTTYESLLYPTQISGDPSFVYPTEVMATTTSPTCIPTAEVQNLMVTVSPTSGYDFCWGAVSDPCLQGYEVLGASTPESANNFTALADVGLTTCWNGNPAQRFFLVVARGTGGNGPWGAYGR